jgi:hypothetical protein
MKTEHRLFASIMIFLFLFAGGYALWTYLDKNPAHGQGGVEPIGTTALIMSGLLTAMVWIYFWMVSRRIDPRPEDREDGEISDVSGEVGFFSPGSYWPLGLAAAGTLAGFGVVYWLPWLMVAGVIAILLAVGGLTFEYYTGTRKLGPE